MIVKVLLILFFYAVLSPIAFFFKLIGRDKLKRKVDPDCETYWED